MKISPEDKRYPLAALPERQSAIFGSLEPHIAYTFSGKSAIAMILRYCRAEGVLADKSEQVLVPEWLGTWVYMTMHNYCFPTTTMNKKVRALVAYHQWGFPQKMEAIEKFARAHKLFVIEDCAHTIDSIYGGKQAGTFGGASIWSLSKFFSTPVGGGLYTKDTKLRCFVEKSYRDHDKRLERQVLRGLKSGGAEVARAYAVYDRLSRCPSSAKTVAQREYNKGVIEHRRQNFAVLRKALWGKKEEKLLEDSEVVPWMVPLFAGSANKKIAAALLQAGFESGVYHFDVNRNMLKPKFIECVALPCSHTLSPRALLRVIDIVRALR